MLSLNPETVKRIRANQKTLVDIHKSSDTPKDTVDRFVESVGYYEAVETIATMINSIPNHWDGRISDANYEWAIKNTAICAMGDPIRASFHKTDDIHSAHLDQIATAMRKTEAPADPKRYDILIFDEDGDAISETVFEKEEIAVGIASQHITEASESNEAIRVIVVDTHIDECLYEAQTIGTAYRIFEDWQSENETEPVYSAEEAAQAYADWLSDSIEGKDAYDNMLDECYEIIRIGSLTYYPSEVLEKTDPIAYRCGLSDWADSEYSDCLYNLERLDYGETWSGWGLNIKLVHIAEERRKDGEWVTL